MKKRLLGLILALGMVVAIVPMALAATTENCPGNCEHVAAIGTTHYDTLQAAVDAVVDKTTTTTINLRKSASGDGVKVPEGSNITFNLGGFTYDIVKTVGSSGTETNGFQLLQNSTIRIENGTITSNTAQLLI